MKGQSKRRRFAAMLCAAMLTMPFAGALAESGAELITPVQDSGAELITPVQDSGAEQITPVQDSGAELVTPVQDSGAELITPAQDSGVELITPAQDSGAELITPVEPVAPPAELIAPVEPVAPPAELITPVEPVAPPAEQITPPAPSGQFSIDVSTAKGALSVTVKDALAQPMYVEITKPDGTTEIKTIDTGNGTATFTGLAAGMYSVYLDYVSPVSGVDDVWQDGIMLAEGADVIPVVSGQFKVVTQVSGTTITVSVTDALAQAVDVVLIHPNNYTDVRQLSAGNGDISFANLPNGSYSVIVAYQAQVQGASSVRREGLVVAAAPTQAPAPSAPLVELITPQPAPTASPTAAPTAAPPASRPPISVNAITHKDSYVTARSTPGTLVNLGTYDYGQTLTADANGMLYYSLPHEYANGTKVTFTIYYGSSKEFSYQHVVTVGEKQSYTLLKRGYKNDAVYTLTLRLVELGYLSSATDYYSDAVVSAVRNFQVNNGLSVDGIAGPKTQAALYATSAVGANVGGYTTLSRSSRYNARVVTLQRRLKALNYLSGSVDGYFGSQTYRAVRNFQYRNGITVTGIADAYTQQVLYSAAAKTASGGTSGTNADTGYRLLYWGCEGEAVTRLQKALLGAGYTQVRTADGIYGKWTYDAVCAFQRNNGLSVDGIAGKKTQNKLYGTSY